MKIRNTYTLKVTLLIILCSHILSSYGQDMKAGFAMLESGQFQSAEKFFGKTLTDYPDNKTAKLCFGRATGLSGNTDAAIQIFEELLQEYPGDMEVRLNLAEAYLWKKDGKSAVVDYLSIIKQDSTLFAAQLGLANSYSMTQNYGSAYATIQTAIDLDPNNQQAALSRKYITLGLANELASRKHLYDSALTLVDKNLKYNPKDQESLQLKATIYLIAGEFESSDDIYLQLSDTLASIKGQSLTAHLLEDNELALNLADSLVSMASIQKDTSKIMDAHLHYVTALLWNEKISIAGSYLDSLSNLFPFSPEMIATQAQIAMYGADFKKGSKKYDDYLALMPKSFGGNLGKADAMHALGLDNIAYQYAFRTLTYYPGQKDAANFIERLNAQHSPQAYAGYVYTYSSDGSVSTGYQLEGKISLSPRWSTAINYQQKHYGSKIAESGESYIESTGLSLTHQLNATIKLQAAYGVSKLQLSDTMRADYRSRLNLSAQLLISKSQSMTIGYFSEIQDFNQALIQQKLKVSNFVIKNSFFWKESNLGWYSELYRSYFSDGNTKNLLFTSLYKNLTKKPAIKAGINYTIMNFSENKPEQYYSPKLYNQMELFTGLMYNKLPVDLSWDLAGGFQMVDGMTQPTWRTKLALSKKIGRLNTEVSGAYSSISSSQYNGFSHLELRGQLTYRLSDKPIFFKRIASSTISD
ncbi:tetratricopeptide repeat protein [Reichenbachiella agarivorans]|uniref:Tetratricopeptide repeat protein n=1 Tax=Reichenbachiella agarivorans TaxID=2979464 RepID=A0ABY6CNK9_9BACT|nr:tetratricopeptide repeat protein [Reichenbachiella agarivorans]UXP32103.1 tetratricopeptide repeat protein [Reichenbachiella agarivorans]